MKWEEKKKINLRTSFQQGGKAENNTQIHLSPLRIHPTNNQNPQLHFHSAWCSAAPADV